ncbi:MAG: hypothetical protein O3C60_14660 [Planctomycetota bacterium]|nr:hypothetical protein [Planctomycetota bacterium]
MTAENATNLVGRSEPVLSVVYVTLDDYRTNQASVRNLAQQTAASSIEVVFVCPDPQRFQSDEEDLSPFSGWQVIGVGNLLGAGEAMAAGIRAARGSLVGYGEEHSYPTPDWAERIIADFEAGPWSAVGFAMDNHNPQTMTSWAHLYGQFGSVVAPVSSGEVEVAGGHHVVYRHEVLLKFGDDLGRMMEDECALFFHLRERGYKIYLDGEAVAAHTNVEQWHAMASIEYYGHRGFAATRAMHWSWPR